MTCIVCLQAQDAPKWNHKLRIALEQYEQQQVLTRGTVVCDTIPTILQCNDSAETSSLLTGKGIAHTVISEHFITVNLPVDQIRTVGTADGTHYMASASQMDPTMSEARESSHTNEMTSGTSLETPFTGKGVIIGVIDQGFEYTHPVYKDKEGNLRIKAIWNRYKNQGKITNATQILGYENDGMDATHGTMTAAIAAGSKVSGVAYEGIATDAELILISSQLYDNETLEGARFVKDYARLRNQPAVINMSFGSVLNHAHDGTGSAVTPFNELSDKGCIFVAAAGNDGESPIHVSHRFTAEKDTARILLTYQDQNYFLTEIWGSKGARGFKCTPFIFDTQTGKETVISATNWKNMASVSNEYDAYGNQMENLYIEVSHPKFLQLIGTAAQDTKALGLYITGPKDATFHGWTRSSFSVFTTPTVSAEKFLIPDSKYTLSRPSTAERVVCVASYTSSKSYTDITGTPLEFTNFTVNDLSGFSSRGPLFESNLPKPTIAAPGAAIKSAMSKQQKNFDNQGWNVVRRVAYNRTPYYYGIFTGTSCASPIVAGTIACWLQAYPDLTPEQAMDILKKTAVNDEYTKNPAGGWNPDWGYGKMNAYEGLKECLKLAASTGVNDTQDTTEPVTLLKTNDSWKVLFNNAESFADIAIYTLEGKCIGQKRLNGIACAQEEIIDLNGVTAGVYLIQIRTANRTLSRKVMKY